MVRGGIQVTVDVWRHRIEFVTGPLRLYGCFFKMFYVIIMPVFTIIQGRRQINMNNRWSDADSGKIEI